MPHAAHGRSPASRLRRALVAVAMATALVLGHPTAPAEAAARPGEPKILKVFVKGTGTLKVTWSGAKRATRYQVLVATNKKMTKGRKVLRTKKRTRTVSGLKQGTTYYVKVRAYRGTRLGPWGPRKAKRTLYATPGTPAISARGTGYSAATFSWSAATYATRYRVVITRGPGMGAVLQRTPWQTGRAKQLANLRALPAGTFYYARVEASNAGRASRYSAAAKVQLRPYSPVAPRIATEGARTISVAWTRATNADRYQLQARVGGVAARTVTTNHLAEGLAAVNGMAAGVPYQLYVRSLSGTMTSPWVAAGTATATSSPYRLTVGTYNVACANPGLRCSTVHRWSQRKAAVARMIDSYGYDVVGTQETSTDPVGAGVSQGVDLDRQLRDPYRYGAHAKGRWIYYNPATVEETGQEGEFQIGYSTGSRKTQYAVWQVFRHRVTGEEFAVVNAHLDSYVGYAYDVNRNGQTTSLLAQTAAVPEMRGLPVIHVGDYNSHELRSWDGPRNAFLNAGYLDADDYAADRRNATFNSANGWRNPNPRQGAHTDHVYVPRGVGVSLSSVDLDTDSAGRWRSTIPSDHNPVRAVLDMPAS